VLLNQGWSVFQANGRIELAIPLLQRAKELAGRLQDKSSLGEALIRLETIHLVQGDLQQASEQAATLAPVLAEVPDTALRLLAKQLEATTLLLARRFPRGSSAARRPGGVPRDGGQDALGSGARTSSGFLDGLVHVVADGRAGPRGSRLSRRAQQITERAYDPFEHEHAAMLAEGALLHAWRREPALASELAKRALAISEKRGFAKWQGRAELILRWAEAELVPSLPCSRVEELLSKPWQSGSVGRTMHAMLFIAMCARLGRAEPALQALTTHARHGRAQRRALARAGAPSPARRSLESAKRGDRSRKVDHHGDRAREKARLPVAGATRDPQPPRAGFGGQEEESP